MGELFNGCICENNCSLGGFNFEDCGASSQSLPPHSHDFFTNWNSGDIRCYDLLYISKVNDNNGITYLFIIYFYLFIT